MRGNIFIVSEDTYARVVDFIIELESLTPDRSLTLREAVAPGTSGTCTCPKSPDGGIWYYSTECIVHAPSHS